MERDIMGDSRLPPEVIWGESPPPTWHFNLRASFAELCTEIHQVMLYTAENWAYNPVPSITRFYKAFKAQDKNLEEFYNNCFEAQIYEDSLCCIGLSLQLRRNLLKKLSSKYPLLEKHLYFGTGNGYPFTTWPERYEDQPPNHTGQMKDHAMMVLKFTLEQDRPGFLILDLGFCILIPIIVMEDGLSPHTGSFESRSRNGVKTYEFSYHSDRFIHWLDTRQKSGTQIEVNHRYFFVGKPLINPRQIEKRDKVYGFHAMVYLNSTGPETGCFSVYQKNDYLTLFKLDPSNDGLKFIPVPKDYFDEDIQKDPDVEDVLNLISKRAGQSIDKVKTLLREWSIIVRDEEYLNQVMAIHKQMELQLET